MGGCGECWLASVLRVEWREIIVLIKHAILFASEIGDIVRLSVFKKASVGKDSNRCHRRCAIHVEERAAILANAAEELAYDEIIASAVAC